MGNTTFYASMHKTSPATLQRINSALCVTSYRKRRSSISEHVRRLNPNIASWFSCLPRPAFCQQAAKRRLMHDFIHAHETPPPNFSSHIQQVPETQKTLHCSCVGSFSRGPVVAHPNRRATVATLSHFSTNDLLLRRFYIGRDARAQEEAGEEAGHTAIRRF